MNAILRLLEFFLARPALPWSAFALWAFILFVVSGSPPPQDMKTLVPFQDKILHFVFFAGGAFALAGALLKRLPPSSRLLLPLTVAIIAACGALDEFNQQFVPGRAGLDPFDWLADFSGAVLGAFLLKSLHARIR
jgi:VanZ family protein